MKNYNYIILLFVLLFSFNINAQQDDQEVTAAGKYSTEGVPLVIDIYVKNDKLFIEVMNQSLELTPVAEDKFKIEAASLDLTFDTKDGTMQFKQGPYQIKLKRE